MPAATRSEATLVIARAEINISPELNLRFSLVFDVYFVAAGSNLALAHTTRMRWAPATLRDRSPMLVAMI
jgi:hypothetical protein